MKDIQQTEVFEARVVDASQIVVAIPTLNEESYIEKTLLSLLQDAPEMAQCKIVVADGGSTDQTRTIVRRMALQFPNIELLDNPDKLQSAAVNRVVEHCAEPHHRILVRVDAHSRYPTGYVLRVADSLVERKVQALATVMDSVGETCFQKGVAWASDTKLGSGGSGHRGGTVSGFVEHGHHAGFLLETWRVIGGYNTGFVANEDAELDHRIGLSGGKIWLDATIRLDYEPRRSLAKLGKQYWRYGRGRAQTVLLHRIRPKLRQMVPPAAVVANLLGIALSPLWIFTLAVPAAYTVAVMVTTLSLILSRRSSCAVWATPALVVMHHLWGLGFLFEILRSRKGRG